MLTPHSILILSAFIFRYFPCLNVKSPQNIIHSLHHQTFFISFKLRGLQRGLVRSALTKAHHYAAAYFHNSACNSITHQSFLNSFAAHYSSINIILANPIHILIFQFFIANIFAFWNGFNRSNCTKMPSSIQPSISCFSSSSALFTFESDRNMKIAMTSSAEHSKNLSTDFNAINSAFGTASASSSCLELAAKYSRASELNLFSIVRVDKVPGTAGRRRIRSDWFFGTRWMLCVLPLQWMLRIRNQWRWI